MTSSRTAARALAALTTLAVVATACGGGSDDGSADTTAAPTSAPTTLSVPAPSTTAAAPTTSTTAPAAPVAPLTGLPAADPTILGRPPLVVKIDNHPDAMPQSGLAEADVIYEELVEGISRFAVVFHDKAPYPVGPIRSARTSDPDIVTALGRPLFAWSGGNPGVTRAIGSSNLVDVGFSRKSVEGGYYRERARRAPHNLYADARALFTLAEAGQPAPTPLFTYRSAGEAMPASATDADGVKVVFQGTQALFQWDAELKGWARSQYGKPHADANGARVAPANVVVMFTEYRRSPADPISPEAVTVGEGFVWVFSEGKVVTGVWKRSDASQPAQLLDKDLQPIELTPGQTWVALAQGGKAVTVPKGTNPSDVPWPR